MSLQETIRKYLENPFPIWEKDLTTKLVNVEWDILKDFGIYSDNYTTAKGYFKKAGPKDSLKIPFYTTSLGDIISLELPQYEELGGFYDETGLELEVIPISDRGEIIAKLTAALNMLAQVEGIVECIGKLVRTITVIHQDDPEIDCSHSDPNIPFSIFVSVCENTSEISNLRVAESILHEAMHLKLTLIEKAVDLVVPATNELFYSPWRDELRPIRGVLHGLFVFSSVKSFYEKIHYRFPDIKYLGSRNSDIKSEFLSIGNLKFSDGLSDNCKIFASKLLQ